MRTKKNKKWLIIAGLLLTVSLSLAGCSSKDSGSTSEKEQETISVAAANGTYIGHDNDGIAEFLGVSYAAPLEKWKAPKEPTTTEKDTIKCDKWGPSCIQIKDDVEVASSYTQDYDCLDLNVWTKDVNTKDKPVLVFIHGGGAWQGGSYDPSYDGEHFVRNLPEGEDAIMITINYRLGVFGSLNLSSLEGYTKDYADANNLATLDQIQALRWINKNITAFGGDKDNVTLMGQSSGAGSTCTMLTIPEATKYFNNAVIESGSIFNRQISVAKSQERAKELFKILGVKSVDELINISNEDMIKKYPDVDKALHLDTSVPEPQRVADDRVVPLDGYDALKKGSADGINVMIGTTDGEYDWLASDWDNYPKAIKDNKEILAPLAVEKGDSADLQTTWSPINNKAVVDEYFAQDEDKVLRAVDLYNDTKYRQTAIYIAEALSKNKTDVYMYYWKWAPDVDTVIKAQGDSAEVSPWGRAMHCMDQVLSFGTVKEGYPELTGPAKDIPKDLLTATQMTWYNFAKNGNPNNDSIPKWKPYDEKDRETMIIEKDATWKLVKDPRAKDRMILDKAR